MSAQSLNQFNFKRSDFAIRSMGPADSDDVLRWRNSDEVRTYMYDTSIISPDSHTKWYASILEGKLRVGFIFIYRDQPAGVVCANLRNSEKNSYVWGCYLIEPGKFPGIGTIMGLLAMEELFENQKIDVLIGEMKASNDRSRKFNLNIGFKIIAEDHEKSGLDAVAIKSVLFEQTQLEWLNHKNRLFGSFFGKTEAEVE